MCTSKVADNTQMANLNRQVTQNGQGLTKQWQEIMYNDGIPRYQDDIEVTVVAYGQGVKMVKVADVKSLAKLSGGVVDVELFLVSRNTLGNGKATTQNLQSKMSNGGSGMRWWY